jgi:hypothetical protein
MLQKSKKEKEKEKERITKNSWNLKTFVLSLPL